MNPATLLNFFTLIGFEQAIFFTLISFLPSIFGLYKCVLHAHRESGPVLSCPLSQDESENRF